MTIRKKGSKWEQVRIGVRRIRDPHSDYGDGWRYQYSKAETKRVLLEKIIEQNGLCSICHKELTDIRDVAEAEHTLPRGMNGGRRDDRFITAAHRSCNLKKGSQRFPHDNRSVRGRIGSSSGTSTESTNPAPEPRIQSSDVRTEL